MISIMMVTMMTHQCRSDWEIKLEIIKVSTNLGKSNWNSWRLSSLKKICQRLSLMLNRRDLITTWEPICSEALDIGVFPRIRTSGRWWLWSIKKRYILELYRTNLMPQDIMTISQSFPKAWAPRPTSSTLVARSSRSFKTTI
jgi:hypothetical protein